MFAKGLCSTFKNEKTSCDYEVGNLGQKCGIIRNEVTEETLASRNWGISCGEKHSSEGIENNNCSQVQNINANYTRSNMGHKAQGRFDAKKENITEEPGMEVNSLRVNVTRDLLDVKCTDIRSKNVKGVGIVTPMCNQGQVYDFRGTIGISREIKGSGGNVDNIVSQDNRGTNCDNKLVQDARRNSEDGGSQEIKVGGTNKNVRGYFYTGLIRDEKKISESRKSKVGNKESHFIDLGGSKSAREVNTGTSGMKKGYVEAGNVIDVAGSVSAREVGMQRNDVKFVNMGNIKGAFHDKVVGMEIPGHGRGRGRLNIEEPKIETRGRGRTVKKVVML